MQLRRSERLKRQVEEPVCVNRNTKRIKKIDNNDSDIDQDNYSEDIWNELSNYCAPTNAKYVSATAIRNYMLKDPLIDWLELYYLLIYKSEERIDIQEKLNKEKNNINILLENGLIFENKVINELKLKFKNNYTQVANDRFDLNDDHAALTLKYMKEGIPIIFQAVLINKQNKTHGIADIIVRSDYINKLMSNKDNHLSQDEININAPNINSNNYHYRVIDVKWSTLHLCADGILLRNDNRMPAYKGQLAIYNCALGNMQGYIPNKAFILGNSWKYETCGDHFAGHSCFDLLGHIDYSYFDKDYIERTVEAIDWVHNVRINGNKWKIIPPSNKYLYPNMSNQNDTPWGEVKKIIANSIDELTQLWMVGPSNRVIGHSNNIFKWSDHHCSANLLGINGPKKSVTLDKILEINHSKSDIILPKIIKNNMSDWQTENYDDYYVDFETVNGCFLNEPKTENNNDNNENNIIFMIGCGYIENNKWVFKQFTVNNITNEEEQRIITEWKKFVISRTKHRIARFFHWSNAEVTTMKFANIRHDYKWHNMDWIDMYKVFNNEPIVIKGALNFKLGTVAETMYKHNMIQTTWENDDIPNGLAASLLAIKYYNNPNEFKNKNIIESIGKYNEVDCKVMWEMIDYLRKYYI